MPQRSPLRQLENVARGCLQRRSERRQGLARDLVGEVEDRRRQAQLAPLLNGIRAILGTNPDEVSADAGYYSAANLRAIKRRRIEGYIANRKAEARHQVRHRGTAFKSRLADRQDEHQAQARRLPKSLPLA